MNHVAGILDAFGQEDRSWKKEESDFDTDTRIKYCEQSTVNRQPSTD
ncbi:hypothetical protein QT979_03795 [Microcoleus sp. w2-18bC1]